MKIKLDNKHYLNSDQFCYWITVQVESEKKKVYEKRISGYARTLEQAFESYIDRKIVSSEADSIAKLKKDVAELKRKIRAWKIVLEGENNE